MAEHNNCKTAHDQRKAAAQVVEGQAAGSNSTASKLKAAKNEAMVEQAKMTLNQRAANRKVLFRTDSTASNASGTGPMGPPANPGGASASAGGSSGSGGAAGSAGDGPVPKAKGKAAK